MSLYLWFADIDECTQFPGLCKNGICRNTLGSFVCECSTGLTLDFTQKNCVGKHSFGPSMLRKDENCWLIPLAKKTHLVWSHFFTFPVLMSYVGVDSAISLELISFWWLWIKEKKKNVHQPAAEETTAQLAQRHWSLVQKLGLSEYTLLCDRKDHGNHSNHLLSDHSDL